MGLSVVETASVCIFPINTDVKTNLTRVCEGAKVLNVGSSAKLL